MHPKRAICFCATLTGAPYVVEKSCSKPHLIPASSLLPFLWEKTCSMAWALESHHQGRLYGALFSEEKGPGNSFIILQEIFYLA